MTTSISPQNSKTAVASQLDSSLNKVSSAKTKDIAPGNASEILNKPPSTQIAETPAAVVSLGNNKALGQDLYKKTGALEKSEKKSTDTNAAKTAQANTSASAKNTEVSNLNQNSSVNTRQQALAEKTAVQEKSSQERANQNKVNQERVTQDRVAQDRSNKASAYTTRATAESQLKVAV